MQSPTNRVYTSTFQCMRSIVAKESITGLYRGLSSPMAGVSFVNALVFGAYGNIQRRSSDPNSLMSHFWAGTTAGLMQCLITSPMELAKTRMQVQSHQTSGPLFRGPIDCMLHINRTEGLRGLFRGFGITAYRDVPGFAIYFVVYEATMRTSPNPSGLHTLMCGGWAGCMSWLFTLPFDVIKTRLQADGNGKISRYSGIMDCAAQSYRAEGISFITHGFSSTMVRAFLTNSVCFFVVEYTMRILDKTQIEVDVGLADKIVVAPSEKQTETAPHSPHPPHHPHGTHISHTHRFGIDQTMQYMSALSDAINENETLPFDEDLSDEVDAEGDKSKARYYFSRMEAYAIDGKENGAILIDLNEQSQ